MRNPTIAGIVGSVALTLAVGCNQLPTSKLTKQSATALKPTIQVSLEQSGKILSQGSQYGSSIKTSNGNGVQPTAGNCNLNLSLSEDKDKDLVPLSASATADCNWTGTNGDFAKLTGSFSAIDKDDNDPTSGVKLEGKDIGYAYKFGVFTDSFMFGGLFDLTKTGSGQYGLILKASTTRNADSLSHDFNLTGASDVAIDPFKAGTLNGTGSTTLRRGSELINATATVTDLHFTKTCTSTGFDRGTVAWTDGTNTLTVEYKACGSIEVKYNNELI
jgi:hypothetical protein